jgi:ribonuclease Z
MKKFFSLAAILLVLLGLGQGLLKVPVVQDMVVSRGSAMLAAGGGAFEASENLRVYVCGSASPLGMGQAQACIAVVTPEHFFLIDSGAGSTNNINRMGLPIRRLQGLLITHFHSDHIAEIYEVNLGSWVGGRPIPLTIYGPRGIGEVIDGINETYRLDRIYRVGHHGLDILPPALGKLKHQTIEPGVIFEDAGLKITAYVAQHPPIEPAVGYRFDYNGRSVVISGDSNVNGDTFEIVEGADLLLHDALSLPTVSRLSKAMGDAGFQRRSKIVDDVIDYHASTQSLIELGEKSDVDMVAFYHLVPVPANSILKDVFTRGVPDNFLLAEDLMWFDLPLNSDEIIVHRP